MTALWQIARQRWRLAPVVAALLIAAPIVRRETAYLRDMWWLAPAVLMLVLTAPMVWG